ncbi:MAG: glycosyltransferase, partial [Saccharolobus sp.]
MISIIIPAFNEEKRIGKTLEKISSTLPNAEVVVVFDGHDNTPEVVKKFSAKLIKSESRLGKGGALKKGINESNFQRVLLLDADFPITEEELDKILNTDADLVIPKRKIVGMPLKRRFLHKAFIIITKIFFPSLVKFSDFQAGVKLVNREKVSNILDELIINDLLFDVNLIYAFKRRHYKVK